MVACALSLRISKRQWSGRARQSSPTLQPLRELRTSIEHQFAQSQVFATPMPQPTPSIRDLTTPSEHQIATIEEVIPPLGEAAEPIQQDATPFKQEAVSSSQLNSTLISRQNFMSQEGANQIPRQNHPSREVPNLCSRQNSQSKCCKSECSPSSKCRRPGAHRTATSTPNVGTIKIHRNNQWHWRNKRPVPLFGGI